MSRERKSVSEMVSEWMRESGAMLAVFAAIGALLEHQDALTCWVLVFVGLGISVAGLIIERRARKW